MAYAYSHLDNSLLEWFASDTSAASLRRIEITQGSVRGLNRIGVPFDFPIATIAGPNGCGKSTLLALAACAYHSTPAKFNPFGRPKPYYTLADFFIQAADEQPVSAGISYHILFDRWKGHGGQNVAGLRRQERVKKPGGRWTNYDTRVPKCVAYLGINRVVPEYEEKVLRTYHRMLAPQARAGWESSVVQSVGSVLGRQYKDLSYIGYRSHKVPVVQADAYRYSGFNMGAGESALLELFATIYACNEPLLVVVDEIELGLHEEAQARLIAELKRIAKPRRLQVICTSHSAAVLAALPPEARILVEPRLPGKPTILVGVSPEYATGRLSGKPTPELDILVEDQVAISIVQAALPLELRHRIRMIPVGSHAAVMRHLAARVAEKGDRPACAILDGDQRSRRGDCAASFAGGFERRSETVDRERQEWLEKRLAFLPGTSWPELWILEALLGPGAEGLDSEYGLQEGERRSYYDRARAAGKHREFFSLAHDLGVDLGELRNRLARLAMTQHPEQKEAIISFTRQCIEAAREWPA